MITVRFHLQDQGYIAANSQAVLNLGSELTAALPAGSGSIAQISLDSSGSLTINASNLQAAQQLASLVPKNIVKPTETGAFVFSDVQGNTSLFNTNSIVSALNALVFPGATLVRDI